jgi:hypothetical protein
LFFSFSFLSGYQILCVVNALIKGEIEDHVWFEDRWMVGIARLVSRLSRFSRWASIRWRKSEDFQILPWGACIPSY